MVPRVVGLKLGAAKTRIARAHCRTGKVASKASSKKKKGVVLGQSPRAGTTLANGARVNLVVGKGPKKK